MPMLQMASTRATGDDGVWTWMTQSEAADSIASPQRYLASKGSTRKWSQEKEMVYHWAVAPS